MDDETQVVSIVPGEHGVEISVEFAADMRKGIGRAHTFFVTYEDNEEFSQAAKDLVQAAKDLAWEIHAGWGRQPRLKEHRGD